MLKDKMENYTEYLKSDHWKERRKAFRSKSCGRCFICEKKSSLMDVHHKTYYKNGESILFHETDGDLALLCHTCHDKLHKYDIEGYLREDIADNLKKEKINAEFSRREQIESRIVTIPPQRYREVYDRKGNKVNYKGKKIKTQLSRQYVGIFN